MIEYSPMVKMSILRRTKELIALGRSNTILSIPTRLNKLDRYVYGTRQGCFYLYGGETGTGKTTLARELHMHNAYEKYKEINDTSKLDVLFADFSLEISAEINMGAAISRKVYQDYGEVLPVPEIFGWDKERPKLTDQAIRLIDSYDGYFRDFEDKMIVYDSGITPTQYHDALMAIAKKNGKFKTESRWISDCGEYTPNNPRLFVIIIVDTVNLADQEPGNEFLKAAIDRISRDSVLFRNKCGFTIVMIQQFNADISATDRSRFGITTPQLKDYEDSKRTTKDANVVLGLYDPSRHMKEENTFFRGYDIAKMKGFFRSLHILKNRNGQSNKVLDLKFAGATGTFSELPNYSEVDYEKETRY